MGLLSWMRGLMNGADQPAEGTALAGPFRDEDEDEDEGEAKPVPAVERTPVHVARREGSERVRRTYAPTFTEVMDLTGLESVRMRIKGTSYYVEFDERDTVGSTSYLLKREPRNKHDKMAVAIYGNGRKVGYVSATRAAVLSPMLKELGAEAFLVGGAGTRPESGKLWVDLPRTPALREFVQQQAKLREK